MRLSKEDITLLRTLENAAGGQHAGHQTADSDLDAIGAAEHGAPVTEAPRAMFEFNLVQRLPSGALQITKTGSRALFQAECIAALEMAAAGAPPDMTGGVERWLVSSGFLHPAERTVTARGKLWLSSLSPQSTSTPQAPAGADRTAATAAGLKASAHLR